MRDNTIKPTQQPYIEAEEQRKEKRKKFLRRVSAESFGFLKMSLLSDLINLNLSDITDKVIAEYIWVGGSGMDMRSKARTLSGPVKDPSKLPKWNYDGSSTGQAPGQDSEVILYPQAIFKDPFRRGSNILVMCDAYTPAGEPIPTNKRNNAAKIFGHPDVVAEEPWYGLEQEYTLLQKDVQWPLGWPLGGFPGPQGPYYCGTGANKAFGRDIVDSHYKACIYAGINISGINGEVMPGQWEFQVGPSIGISAADELWVARYILERITEIAGVVLSFDPKPIQGDWNGAGAHTNYSTKSMRNDGGYEVIKKAIAKLEKRHKEHIAAYGEGNERRLTGRHETADMNTFVWGVANRGASIRVGRDTEKAGKGYFEDRRPASNMDPYVMSLLSDLININLSDTTKKVIAEYGIEPEYTLLQKDVQWPLGWSIGGFPGPQGPYYCGIGANKAFGRDIVDSHFKACLYADINITGINAEVMPGQWEFRVGPSLASLRVTTCGLLATFWSTKSMRNDGGYEVIRKATAKLEKRHKEHIAAYGEGNERRLTGQHETADINTFIRGVANRGASIRVGRDAEKAGKGYLRRIGGLRLTWTLMWLLP
ncbi:Glutamine synthetase cytosolic isozyme 2 [Glycine soja]